MGVWRTSASSFSLCAQDCSKASTKAFILVWLMLSPALAALSCFRCAEATASQSVLMSNCSRIPATWQHRMEIMELCHCRYSTLQGITAAMKSSMCQQIRGQPVQ